MTPKYEELIMEDTVQSNSNSAEAASSVNGMPASVPPKEGGTSPEKRKSAAAKKYMTFEDAKRFAQDLHLKSRKEWREYVKGKRSDMNAKPDDIPAHPDGIYKTKGWQGWRHWLGTEKPAKDNLN